LFKFFLTVALFTVIIIIIVFWGEKNGWWAKPSFLYESLIFLIFTTAVIFIYLFKVNKPDFFVQLYLLSMAVKLLAFGVFNFIMITEDKAGAMANVLFFMLSYFIFTFIEITFLYRKINSSTNP
jgi:hypothetical protein